VTSTSCSDCGEADALDLHTHTHTHTHIDDLTPRMIWYNLQIFNMRSKMTSSRLGPPHDCKL